MADVQGGAQQVGGDTSHDAADSGRPVKVGGRARTTAITAVATDDRVDAVYSTTGGALQAGQDGGVPRDIAVNASGQLEVDIAAAQAGSLAVAGDVANDAADSGNPVKIGHQAAEFAADPPQVSADADRVNSIATPQGIQWTLGGHPNIITREYHATGAQTNDDMLGAVAAGSHVVVTGIDVTLDGETTATSVKVRIGFGATAVPTEPTDGNSVAGVLLAHGGILPGSGVVKGNGSGVIGVGGDGEELRITSTAPTGGELKAIITYYVTTL